MDEETFDQERSDAIGIHLRHYLESSANWPDRIAEITHAVHRGNYLDLLGLITDGIKDLQVLRDYFVVEAKRGGATWQDIGEALRTPRQVAWRKYNSDI